MAATKDGKKENEAALAEARSRFKEAVDADSSNRNDALDDLKFLWNLGASKDDPGYQWPQDAKSLRAGRPMLVENRLPQFVRQVVNSQRQNRPSIAISPASGEASVQSAKVIEGLVRHIEQWSKADLAYDNAYEAAVSSGIGYFRVTTEYADDQGFDQEVCIRPIDNPFSVYDDSNFQLPDASDRKWCFVTEWVDRKDFEAKYGFEPVGISESSLGDDKSNWYEDERVRVAEYWRVRIETQTVYLQADGSVGPAKPSGETQSRDIEKKVVEQFLMTGDKIIKKADWPGCYLPIIPVFGEIKNIDGKKHRKSLIRDAKTSARINNYFLECRG
jgi:hypothetical protein